MEVPLLLTLTVFWIGIGSCQDDSEKGKVLYRQTLGRPATLGMLYSAHSDNLIPGFGFWDESEINENKNLVCHAKAETTYAHDETRSEKHSNLDVEAEIDISYDAGIMVHVWGSAAYLKHDEDISHTSRFRMSYKSVTKTEALSTQMTNNTHPSPACEWKKDGDVPTHVISSITYGGSAHFIFEKFVQDTDDKEKIDAELTVEIENKLKTLKIEGSAKFELLEHEIKNFENTTITTYTDFIIREQPTTIEEAIILYKEISTHLGTKEDNYASSVPMSMTLLPLSRFCPETDQLAEEIAANIMKRATDVRLTLLDTERKIDRLLRNNVAVQNFRIRKLLSVFKADVSNFTITYEKKLQRVIVDARNPLKPTNQNDLNNLLDFYLTSDFNFDNFVYDYLTEREREINAIRTLYVETVAKDEPQIAAYLTAKIPYAIITKQLVYVVTFKVLPNFDTEKYSRYVEDVKKNEGEENRRQKWYNRPNLVGSIGKLWTAYKIYFQYNKNKAGRSFHVNLQDAEPENEDSIESLTLFVNGEEKIGFEIPVQPKQPKVCRKENNKKLSIQVQNPPILPYPSTMDKILLTYFLSESHRLKKNPSIKTEHTVSINDNLTTITIEDLEPEESYDITVAFVTEFGSGGPSEVIKSSGIIDTMRKTDGCTISNDEKFKIGNFSKSDLNTITKCAVACAEDQTNIGWSFDFTTHSCFISSEEYTKTVTNETTNEKKTFRAKDKEFKAGWASGTSACSRASVVTETCPRDDENDNIAFLVTGGLKTKGSTSGSRVGPSLSNKTRQGYSDVVSVAVNSVELLGQNKSCTILDLPEPRHSHATFVTFDGLVATCGGITEPETNSSRCLVLDTGAGVWEHNPSIMGDLPRKTIGDTTVTLAVGVFLFTIVDRRYLAIFFLPTGSSEWKNFRMAPFHPEPSCAIKTNDKNQFLYIGFSGKVVFLFDASEAGPGHSGFFRFANMKTGRKAHSCALISDKVIVAGGYDKNNNILKSTEIIDLKTKTVTFGKDLKVPRSFFGMVTVGEADNQMVLAFGGENDGKMINEIENWDPYTEEWEIYEDGLRDVPRSDFGSVVINVKRICKGSQVAASTEIEGDCVGCTPWQDWGDCNKPCGGGDRTRKRSCSRNNNGGDTCQCNTREEEPCNPKPCPVDGGWSAWSSFSACSTTDPYTCGTKFRIRSCTYPPFNHGGKKCIGDNTDTKGCSGGRKLPLKLLGHCQEIAGIDNNTGQVALDGCFPKPEDCLKTCQENSSATGCEFNKVNKNCYIHTAHLSGYKKTDNEICWPFIVSELAGSCTDDRDPIPGNYTSAECLAKCQENDDAQGCEYDIGERKCFFFKCPNLSADSNENILCWTFNKGSISGTQTANGTCDSKIGRSSSTASSSTTPSTTPSMTTVSVSSVSELFSKPGETYKDTKNIQQK